MISHRPDLLSEPEERTEPISQAEMDARIRSVRLDEPDVLDADEEVPLDILQLEEHHHRQNIRLLMRPLTRLHNSRSVSPTGTGSDNCQWLALRAEVASSDQPEHKVLAVTQTSRDIKFSVRIPGETQDDSPRPPLWCELYYDPASDKVIFLNKSDVPIALATIVSQTPLASPPADDSRILNPGSAKALQPGSWRMKVRDLAVLDFRILEKRPVTIYEPHRTAGSEVSSSPPTLTSSPSMKRSLTPDEDEKRVKRRTSGGGNAADDGVIMFLRPGGDTTNSLMFPLPNARESKELSTANTHALLDAERGQTVDVPGFCELDQYQLTKQDPIASTALSAVYTAQHSKVPDNIVTVKVLKTRVANPTDRPYVHERNVIRQADMWLRESQSQEDLKHRSIVKYYGGDARFLSLYMEHVDAQDLTACPRWRSKGDDEFQGTRDDALRILRDISEALSYLHGRHLVHNDIKPANILYAPERGAVLCDFGLSTPASNAPSGGGTPYYVPPEFIGQRLRGPASDVWALGVTMLYLLRKIPFPDVRARRQHNRPLYWLIAGVNNPQAPHKQYGNGKPAAQQMRDWLVEMVEARERLNLHDRLERVVHEMLTPNPHQRITMARICQALASSSAPAPALPAP